MKLQSPHANKGRGLERIIITSAGGRVLLDHHGQQARRIEGNRLIAQRGPVDFSGTVVGCGRSFRCDAKVCSLPASFPVGDDTHFPAHQRFNLISHGEVGAIAGLLVESTAREAYFWLDWTHLKDLAVRSMKWVDSRWVILGPSSHLIRFANIPGVSPAPRPEAHAVHDAAGGGRA